MNDNILTPTQTEHCLSLAYVSRAKTYEQVFYAIGEDEDRMEWLRIRSGGFMIGFQAGYEAAIQEKLRLVK